MSTSSFPISPPVDPMAGDLNIILPNPERGWHFDTPLARTGFHSDCFLTGTDWPRGRSAAKRRRLKKRAKARFKARRRNKQ